MFNAIAQPRKGNPPSSSEHKPLKRTISRAFSSLSNRLSKGFTSNHEPIPDAELEELRNQVKKLREEGRDLNTKLDELKTGLVDTKRKQEAQAQDYERITKELAVAQKFLSTADTLSQSDVVRAAEDLNEEIFQLTSILADKIQLGDKQLHAEQNQARFRGKISALGSAFLDGIIPLELDDPLAIQIGWQAILANWCCDIINAWLVEKQGLNKIIDDVYHGVLKQSGQAIGGRWRSMLHLLADETPSGIRNELPHMIIPTLVALPVVCGYVVSRKRHEELGNAFSQRIGHLLDKCLKLRKTVGEEFTSADLQPYVIQSGNSYDPAYAVLEYEDEENVTARNEGEVVACSLGVGLYSIRSKMSSAGKFLEEREPILKPKVVLQRTLMEITAPSPADE